MQRRDGNANITLLLLEPDFWRFVGIRHVAEQSGHIHVVGERHFEKILTAKRPPIGMSPAVTILAHRLILDHGIAVIPHVRDLFRGTRVLVFGEDDRLELMAEMLAVGAMGYFLMSAPAAYLCKAIRVIHDGKIWAPREAVALLARSPRSDPDSSRSCSDDFDEKNLLQLLCEGLSNKEIATRFGLAEVTIKARMGRLYRKYGVKTRVQLLAAAMKRRLVTLDPDEPATGLRGATTGEGW